MSEFHYIKKVVYDHTTVFCIQNQVTKGLTDLQPYLTKQAVAPTLQPSNPHSPYILIQSDVILLFCFCVISNTKNQKWTKKIARYVDKK